MKKWLFWVIHLFSCSLLLYPDLLQRPGNLRFLTIFEDFFWKSIEILIKFWTILWNFLKFWTHFGRFLRFLTIFDQVFEILLKFWVNSGRFFGIRWDFLKFWMIFAISVEFWGFFWNSVEIWVNSRRFFGIFSSFGQILDDFCDFWRFLRNLMGFSPILDTFWTNFEQILEDFCDFWRFSRNFLKLFEILLTTMSFNDCSNGRLHHQNPIARQLILQDLQSI